MHYRSHIFCVHCPQFPGDSEDKEGTRKLDKTSSSGCCCGLDFLRDANVELEIIHKDGDACRSVDELVRDLPNLKGTTDGVPDAAAATEDSMPHSTGVGRRRGTRRRPACASRDQNGNEPCKVACLCCAATEIYR